MQTSVQRQIARTVGSVARDLLQQPTMTVTAAASTPTPAYLCARCFRPATQARREFQPAPSGRRGFTSTCVKKWQGTRARGQHQGGGGESSEAAAEATSSSTKTTTTTTTKESLGPPQTYFDFFPDTFPAGPPPASPFTPDLRQLRREFLRLQAKVHPDLAAAQDKRRAEGLSARINEAYKTLQEPLRRAQYLLSLKGIDVEDESAKLSETALLMEVMEAREAVEEVEDEEGLVQIREENNARIEASVRVLEECFEDGNADAEGSMGRAADEAIRLRYWMNIEESIHGWEKGKGGGVLHH